MTCYARFTALAAAAAVLLQTPARADRIRVGSPYRVEAIADGVSVRVTVKADSAVAGELVTLRRKVVPDSLLARGGIVDDGAAVVFQGVPGKDGTLVFADHRVRRGRVYGYWASSGGRYSTRALVRVRDPALWWDATRAGAAIDSLAARFPARVRAWTCGETTSGLPLRCVGAGNAAPNIALVGAIHADESGPELLVPVLAMLLDRDAALLDRIGVVMMPLVDADTRSRLAAGFPRNLRKNPRGVDIDRNFPADWDVLAAGRRPVSAQRSSPTYRGKAPASEAETRAVVDFVTRERPRALLCVHGPGARLSGPGERERMRDAARAFTDAAGGAATFAETPGSLPLWASRTFYIPAFDVHCGDGSACPDRAGARAVTTLYRGVRALLESLAPPPSD